MAPLIQIRNLVKTYRDVLAVDNISFDIPQGACVGLLGPNGAGKTTTIEIIEGIISATSGQVLYKGQSRSDAFREEIGIQFQQTSLLAFLTVRETLETFRSLYARSDDIDELIQLCHLGDFAHRMNDKISGGQRQRLLMALALINMPELLFLDEPSTGLDPQARRNLWDIVRRVKTRGKTIVLTTHYMEEAEYLCDDIIIMDHGRVIARGAADELIKAHCGGAAMTFPPDGIIPVLDRLDMTYRTGDGRVEVFIEDVNSAVRRLLDAGADLSAMVIRSPDLEDVFLKLTGRELRA